MNSNIEHQATVDKGLKMKIKRKNVSGANNKAEPKHEIVKTESTKCASSTSSSSSSSSGPGAASSGAVGLLSPPSSSSDIAAAGSSGVSTGATNQGGGPPNAPGSTSGNNTTASSSANGVPLLTPSDNKIIKPSPITTNTAAADNSKQEKSPKMKGSHKKEKVKDKSKNNNSNTNNPTSATTTNTTLTTSVNSTNTTTATTTTTPASSSSSSSSSSLTTQPSSSSLLSSSSSTSLAATTSSCMATSCTPSSSSSMSISSSSGSSSSTCPSSLSSSSTPSISSCAPLASGAAVDCCAVSSNGSNNNNNTNSSSSSSSQSASATPATVAAASSITNGLDTSSPVIYNNNSNNSNSNNNNSNTNANSSNNNTSNISSTSMVEPPRGGGDVPHLKKENPTPDPYEFNAKVEDGFGIPIKKIKVEKVEAACSPMQPEVHDIGIDTCSVGVITEPECLGPCEPGTSVTLEGIVWHETENGVLVINVTWRGKTYVGTLLDATKHDWAPPRFNCDSPVSELESRTPKGRGKRGRGNTATPVNERVNSNNSNNNSNSSNANNSSNNNNNSNNEGRKLRKGRRCGGNSFQAPPSPAKPEHDRSSSLKRKGRPSDLDLSVTPDPSKNSKRCRSSSRGATSNTTNQNTNAASSGSIGTTATNASSNGSTPGESTSPGLLTCPEANCNKQYKHINGLRYHQSHAHHSAMLQAQEAEENVRDDNTASMEENATDEEIARVRKDECGEMSAGKGSRKDKIKEEATSDDNIPADCSTEQQQSDAGMRPPSSADDSEAQKCALEKMPNIKIEPCLEGVVKTEKVTIKTEHPSSCSGPLPPSAPPGHAVSSSLSKQSLTTQIYQLAAAPMGCLGSGSVAMVTQTNCQIGPLVSTSSASSPVSSQPLPITVGPISHVSESDKSMKTDKSVLDKSKMKTPTRPIVPAPAPQILAFAGGVGPNHPGLTSGPSTHTQGSPSLKPIQPKPTILGEPMNINPALVGLKDKKAKQKKKCKDGVKPGELGSMKGDIPKYERTAVIKAVASPPKPGMELIPKKEPGSLMEPPHLTSDLSRPGASALGCGNSVIASSQVSPKSVDPSHMSRMAQPPGLLKVGPAGLLSTPERKTPVNDDVQSPAYSDISDANESGSPSQADTPVKSSKEESSSSSRKQEKHANQNPSSDQAAAAPVPHYSMYGYYNQQSSYLMPNVAQASSPHVSQSGSSSVSNSNNGTPVSSHKAPGSVKGDHASSSNSGNAASAASSHDEKVSISIDDGCKLIEEKEIKKEKEDPKHKEGGGGGGGGPSGGGPSGGASGPGLPPPEYSQKMFPQYYWPQHSTYQYPYGYMEPYPMHLVPQYRQYEKALEDQKRLQQHHHQGSKDVEHVKKPGDYHHSSKSSGLPDQSKGPSPHSDLPPNMRSIKSSPHGIALKPTPADKMTEGHKHSSEKSLERDRDQALREKQNENHQILKESIELKPQMDKSRYEMSSMDAYRMHDDMRHSEEMQRYYMFNQQKLIGQEKHKVDFASSKTDMQSMESMIPKSSGSHKAMVEAHGRMLPEDHHARETSSGGSSGHHGGGSSSHNPSKREHGADNKQNKDVVRDMNAVGSKSMPIDMKGGDEKQRMMIMDRMRSPAESQKLKGSSYSSSLSASGNSGNGNNSSNIPSSPSTNSGSSSSSATTAAAASATTTTTVASAGSANYPHYLSYPYVQSPAYSQLHFDPYRPFNSVLGYPNPSYMHPTHLAYRVNPNENPNEKDEKPPNLDPPNPPKAMVVNQPTVIGGNELETFKSAEVIHHNPSTPYFGAHKMHELQEKQPLSSSSQSLSSSRRPSPSPSASSNCHSSSSPHTNTNPKTSISETSVSPSPNFEKSRDYQNSPPTQRHVHTHHHTHVVGTTFPLYPPFSNK